MLDSVLLGSLEINNGTTYAVADETWLALESADLSESRLVDMKVSSPAYVGQEIFERKLNIEVWLLAQDAFAVVTPLSNAA